MSHRVVQTFEDTVQVATASELLPQEQIKRSVYWKALDNRSKQKGGSCADYGAHQQANAQHTSTFVRARAPAGK